MGYREVNWSLPRKMQLIHTRQNIFDGTWHKTPSMGWMFVPLSEYHGGGAAATIEPLDEHLGHYEQMIQANLGAGVQACFRGPRLFDTDRTRDMVKRNVQWFKKYRNILESDVIHGRRPDGRSLDWILHANPQLNEKGMLLVYNPTDQEVTQTLRVNLYYTGLTDEFTISEQDRRPVRMKLNRDYSVDVTVTIPAGGMNWLVIREESATDASNACGTDPSSETNCLNPERPNEPDPVGITQELSLARDWPGCPSVADRDGRRTGHGSGRRCGSQHRVLHHR